ncbi:hypothetical protein AVEN_194795-1 [Araneus ventricosus]|uniref:Uncharacterized protein n=1 Tax=Araneus ventricosus TaxID=182803 RepID=A0A4Y2B5E9_ARAVE|nr:hypothetical protein AVEN_194795-1 [Araneus ventricosus]
MSKCSAFGQQNLFIGPKYRIYKDIDPEYKKLEKIKAFSDIASFLYPDVLGLSFRSFSTKKDEKRLLCEGELVQWTDVSLCAKRGRGEEGVGKSISTDKTRR